jgi:hypothetical protein
MNAAGETIGWLVKDELREEDAIIAVDVPVRKNCKLYTLLK